jgi:nucleotide-binding universal stress UspA family protein
MALPNAHLRIVWAVDPSEKNESALHHRARKVIRRLLFHGSDSVIEPVYVFRLSTTISADIGAAWRHEAIAAAEDSLHRFVIHSKIPGLSTPKVLVSSSSTHHRAVTHLCEYAERVSADLIVAQTHGRKGFGRFVLGSFAETILHHSKTPVLLVNPRTRIHRTFGNILFPTDFSTTAANQFRDVLDLAARFGSKITLLHATESLNEALVLSESAGPLPILSENLAHQAARAIRHANAWSKIGRDHGVEIEFILRERVRKPDDDIVRTARRIDADLIVMQTNAGSVGAALLGSVTRQVVRKSPCPVWVLKSSPHHPNEQRMPPSPGLRPEAPLEPNPRP